METLSFTSLIDVPLVIASTLGFVLNYNSWSKSATLESNVDLAARLPVARIRIVAFFVALLTACWLIDIAIWFVFAVLLAVGVLISVFSFNDFSAGLLLATTAGLLREWCFDFPRLILQPPTDAEVETAIQQESLFLGSFGQVVSPLRPSGDVEIAGQQQSAVSEGGQFIENGTKIVVVGTRNGRLSVRPVSDSQKMAGLE